MDDRAINEWLEHGKAWKIEPSLITPGHVYFKLPDDLVHDEDVVVIDANTGQWRLISWPDLPAVVDPDQLFV